MCVRVYVHIYFCVLCFCLRIQLLIQLVCVYVRAYVPTNEVIPSDLGSCVLCRACSSVSGWRGCPPNSNAGESARIVHKKWTCWRGFSINLATRTKAIGRRVNMSVYSYHVMPVYAYICVCVYLYIYMYMTHLQVCMYSLFCSLLFNLRGQFNSRTEWSKDSFVQILSRKHSCNS